MTPRSFPDARRRARWASLAVRASVTRAVATFPLLAAAFASALGAQSSASADSSVRGLPLTVLPAARPGTTLAILLTGDGGWAPLDREVAGALSAAGVGVVGLDVRAYLRGHRRTPEGTAADVARLARGFGARWHATRLVLIGYSRGADMLPFVATRLAADVRERVALLALLGIASRANFEFHWMDLARDVPRASDLPVAPELARLRGMRMLCVYGTDEADSGCRDADSTLIAKAARRGGHHFDGDYEALARLVLGELARTR